VTEGQTATAPVSDRSWNECEEDRGLDSRHPRDAFWLDVRATQIDVAIDLYRPPHFIADLERDRRVDGRGFDLLAMRGIASFDAKPAGARCMAILGNYQPHVNLITKLPLAHLGWYALTPRQLSALPHPQSPPVLSAPHARIANLIRVNHLKRRPLATPGSIRAQTVRASLA